MPAKYTKGEQVSVFYRCGENDSYMPMPSHAQGMKTPRIGQTHGWVPATVMEDYDETVDGPQGKDVRVRYNSTKWIDRSGDVLNPADPRNMLATHPPSRVRRGRPPAPGYLPDEDVVRMSVTVSVVMVRWGDENCDEVKEGDSGWGPTGAVVSDSYISFWHEAIDAAFPLDYQIVTVWVASSEDLTKLAAAAALVKPLLTGRHQGSMYFLWPCQSQDAQHIPSGYVDLPNIMAALQATEAAGIPTRFPHPSHLYKVFLSKDWTSQLCLFPDMRVPATTKVSRCLYERDPLGTARRSLETLQRLVAYQEGRKKDTMPPAMARNLAPAAGDGAFDEASGASSGGGGNNGNVLANRQGRNAWALGGVCKLGYSWEANDVLKFSHADDLAYKLGKLFNQAQGTPEFAFVQDLIVDFDCECRTFVINGVPMRHARRYTQFAKPVEGDDYVDGREPGRFSQFQRGGREKALHEWLGGNDAALVDAEAKMDALIAKYCLWLQTECCDLPPVFRFDAFLRVKKSNPALCDVFSGEVTELGACTLGWDLPDMVKHLFPAVLGSFLEDAPCSGLQALQGGDMGSGTKGGGSGASPTPPCLCQKKVTPGTIDARCDVSAFLKDLKRRQTAHEQWEAQRRGEYEEESGNNNGVSDNGGAAEETGESEGGDDDDEDDEEEGNHGSSSNTGGGGVVMVAPNGTVVKKKRRKKSKKPTQQTPPAK